MGETIPYRYPVEFMHTLAHRMWKVIFHGFQHRLRPLISCKSIHCRPIQPNNSVNIIPHFQWAQEHFDVKLVFQRWLHSTTVDNEFVFQLPLLKCIVVCVRYSAGLHWSSFASWGGGNAQSRSNLEDKAQFSEEFNWIMSDSHKFNKSMNQYINSLFI